MKRAAVAAMLGLAVAAAARAEVKMVEPGGLVVRSVVTIAAPPDKVYAALITPGRWWDSAHSWSGDAANMTLDPVAGGCFCEKIPAARGSAEHARIVYVVPGKAMRLNGALGPFQSMGVAGALDWALKPVAGGTEFSQTYSVGGYVPGGYQGLAPAVDAVMSDQANRLKRFVEGK
jgi:uncharacterized protein YndB with AHSA1/START domain